MIVQNEHFVTNLGMVIHRCEPEWNTEKLVHYLQGQGHIEGSYDQSTTVSAVFFVLLSFLRPNLV